MRRLRTLGAVVIGSAVIAALPLAAAAHSGSNAVRRDAVPKRSIVATSRGRVRVYRRPGSGHPFTTFKGGNGYGQPRVFLVAKRRPGWEKVYLPMRPDGVTGWIRDRSVSLAYDTYGLVVSLGQHRLRLYNDGKLELTTKAGVGRSVSATPTGVYFLVMLLKQPDPNGVYGPYAFGTSAFSNVYYHFGGGPGEIGLHGTDDPKRLGTNVSHGCIRVANGVITRLAKLLPLGTPIVIEK